MSNNQKGIATTFLLLGVLVVLIVGLVFVMTRSNATDTSTDLKYTEETRVTFEDMEEDASTPEEINNSTVDELDKIFEDVESSTPTDDFSDISL